MSLNTYDFVFNWGHLKFVSLIWRESVSFISNIWCLMLWSILIIKESVVSVSTRILLYSKDSHWNFKSQSASSIQHSVLTAVSSMQDFASFVDMWFSITVFIFWLNSFQSYPSSDSLFSTNCKMAVGSESMNCCVFFRFIRQDDLVWYKFSVQEQDPNPIKTLFYWKSQTLNNQKI
jgi:hypothetical protein